MGKKTLILDKDGRKKVLAAAIIMTLLLPFFSAAGDKDIIYVDARADGQENGSSSHPFDTINEALDHADEDTEVHVRPGTYKENIAIPEGVEIFGSSTDKVIIKADDDDTTVVTMRNNTKINKITIKGGRQGIVVKKDAKASIIDCVVKDNRKDGIMILPGDVKDSKKVSITDSEIRNNGRAGIISWKRRVVLMDNEISGNKSDGVDLQAGVSSWMEDNNIKSNGGSGMRAVLDGSQIFTKGNRYADNGHEGIEVNSFGGSGKIDLKKSKIFNNGRWGIARIQRAGFASNLRSGLVIQPDVEIGGNGSGIVSWIVRVSK